MLKVCLPLQVEDRDLDAIGMSTLKKRRFRRGLQEEHDGVSFAERLSPIAKQQIDFDAAEGQFSDSPKAQPAKKPANNPIPRFFKWPSHARSFALVHGRRRPSNR